MKTFVTISFFILLTTSNGKPHPKLLLVSLDGFYYRYMDLFPEETKFLHQFFTHDGIHAVNGMKPPFGTKTFAIHWTIATGLYEEDHGILGNEFYDPDYKQVFSCKTASEEKWFEGEPIWSAAERQGKKTAVIQWIGSAVNFTDHRKRATFVQTYGACNHASDIRPKLDLVHDLLFVQDFDFVMLYFDEPDNAGHWNGAASEAVRLAIQQIDAAFRDFTGRIHDRDLDHNLNIIILAGE